MIPSSWCPALIYKVQERGQAVNWLSSTLNLSSVTWNRTYAITIFSLPVSFQKGNVEYAPRSLKRYGLTFYFTTNIPSNLFWAGDHLTEWSRIPSSWGQSCRRMWAPSFPALEQVHSVPRVEPKLFMWVPAWPWLTSLGSSPHRTLSILRSPLWASFRSHLQPPSHSVPWDWNPEIDLLQASAVRAWLVPQEGKAGHRGLHAHAG